MIVINFTVEHRGLKSQNKELLRIVENIEKGMTVVLYNLLFHRPSLKIENSNEIAMLEARFFDLEAGQLLFGVNINAAYKYNLQICSYFGAKNQKQSAKRDFANGIIAR